jgi:HEAT repeat protein
MRCLGCLALVLVFGLLIGRELSAQTKPPAKDAEKPSITEIGGKSLNQWIAETKSPDASVRENAVRTIMLFGEAAAPAAPALIDRLLDVDVSLRVNACIALGATDVSGPDVPKAIEALGRRVTDDREAIVRFHAAMALSTFGKEAKDAIPKLVNASRDASSWEIRKAAVLALGRAGAAEKDDPLDMRAATALIYALSNEATATVRLEAVMSLGSMGRPALPADQASIEAALKRAISDRDRTVQIWAVVGWMAVKDQVSDEGLTALSKLLKDKELAHRCHSARALGTIGTKARSKMPDLIELLADKQREAVLSAIWALARLGDAKAVPALQEVLQRKEADDGLKNAAKEAIEFLTKKK